jgi:hypothetical protein
MQTLRSSATTRKLSRHTRPAESPAGPPRTGSPARGRDRQEKGGEPGGHLLGPVALVLRAGSKLITNPLCLSPSSPRYRELAKAVPRHMGLPRLDRSKRLFSAWLMLVCLSGSSASPQVKLGKKPTAEARHVP